MSVKINYNGIDKSGKNAVVYARYSSHSQGEQSIEGQLSAAKTYADAKGYTIIHEYIDRAMTGRNDNRDEFQQMLSDCAKKQFQVIIVWKVDRFGRNREEITFNKYRAKKHGVRVEYVAENLPDSPEGVILESVLEGMAEYYSLQLSQNIRRGCYENAKKCKFSGGRVPLGYKLENSKYVIDLDTAPLVRRIYKEYIEGKTIAEIIRELNDEGLHTGQGNAYTKNSLRTILKNEKYIGVFDFKKGTVRIEDGIPAIIDKDTFYKAQKMLGINQRAPAAKWSMSEYILTDKLFCGSCGGAMVGMSGRSKTGVKYNYYACVNHMRSKSCDRKAIRQDVIEDFVLDKIIGLLLNDELVQYIIDSVWDYYVKQDTYRDKVSTLEAQLKETEAAINNIMKAIESGLPFNEMTKSRMTELDNQRTALSKTLAETQLDSGFHLTKEHIQFFMDQLRTLDYSDRNCQRRLIDIFVNSIYITDDELTIACNYTGDNSQLTFPEFKEILASSGFVRCALCSTITRAYELCITEKVFVIKMKMPQR